MFISTREKINLQARVEALEFRADQMAQDLRAIADNLAAKEEIGNVLEAQRKKRNAYATAYYHKRKAERANLINKGKI
jgi:hypothetical protein